MMRHIHFVASQIKPILFLALIPLLLFQIEMAVVQATPETVVKVDPPTSSANLGETFTINITVIDVQNLYGAEVTLYWNTSMLRVVSVDPCLGRESHPSGVLHEPPPVFVAENKVTQELGKYVLAATAVAPAPSFNGTGNIARILFEVTDSGNSKLDLETQLWDRPQPNQASSPIDHTSIGGFVNAVISEFPSTTVLIMTVIVTTLTVVFSKKIPKTNSLHSRFRSQQLKLTFIRIGKVTKNAG